MAGKFASRASAVGTTMQYRRSSIFPSRRPRRSAGDPPFLGMQQSPPASSVPTVAWAATSLPGSPTWDRERTECRSVGRYKPSSKRGPKGGVGSQFPLSVFRAANESAKNDAPRCRRKSSTFCASWIKPLFAWFRAAGAEASSSPELFSNKECDGRNAGWDDAPLPRSGIESHFDTFAFEESSARDAATTCTTERTGQAQAVKHLGS